MVVRIGSRQTVQSKKFNRLHREAPSRCSFVCIDCHRSQRAFGVIAVRHETSLPTRDHATYTKRYTRYASMSATAGPCRGCTISRITRTFSHTERSHVRAFNSMPEQRLVPAPDEATGFLYQSFVKSVPCGGLLVASAFQFATTMFLYSFRFVRPLRVHCSRASRASRAFRLFDQQVGKHFKS